MATKFRLRSYSCRHISQFRLSFWNRDELTQSLVTSSVITYSHSKSSKIYLSNVPPHRLGRINWPPSLPLPLVGNKWMKDVKCQYFCHKVRVHARTRASRNKLKWTPNRKKVFTSIFRRLLMQHLVFLRQQNFKFLPKKYLSVKIVCRWCKASS